jgi:hypothetical protein
MGIDFRPFKTFFAIRKAGPPTRFPRSADLTKIKHPLRKLAIVKIADTDCPDAFAPAAPAIAIGKDDAFRAPSRMAHPHIHAVGGSRSR